LGAFTSRRRARPADYTPQSGGGHPTQILPSPMIYLAALP
jgi:hypothetical protein